MSKLIEIIVSAEPAIRNRSIDSICSLSDATALLTECAALDQFRRSSDNLYHRARSLMFLYAIYRYHLPPKLPLSSSGKIAYSAQHALLQRRFEEAIDILLQAQSSEGASSSLSSGLAAAYYNLCFHTLRGQVRRSVRAVRGNQWMSRIGHPADYPLSLRPELRERSSNTGLYPILRERTPVRMDLSHSGWSDIFFLGMDFPEGARVINISVDLAVRGQDGGLPEPPVEAWLRVIEEPVLRLTSVDLGATADITSFQELFDFGKDYLGLLKAAVIASGLVPPAMEGNTRPLSELLAMLAGVGRGVELVSWVRGIPKGSRLAVSTNLLASLIAVSMRATGQIAASSGQLAEADRRVVAARALLGEWLGGSGGGWQDSGGVWPGIKVIRGELAGPGDPEHEVSRGRLLPSHQLLTAADVSPETIAKLQSSLVLVHGGMAQNVGPILEMVTEKYLLRSETEWRARAEAIHLFDEILKHLKTGDIRSLGSATERNFRGPIQAIIPAATNLYTETLIDAVREEMGSDFWGFWMLGGMSGGGMGFIFDPSKKLAAQERLSVIMTQTKRRLEKALSFAMDPVVYDFAINQTGSFAELLSGDSALMPKGYYDLHVPPLLRSESRSISPLRRAELAQFANACRTLPGLAGTVQNLFDRMLPGANERGGQGSESLNELLSGFWFDREQHDQIQADLKRGRIGLAQNRLSHTTLIEDARPGDVMNAHSGSDASSRSLAERALREGQVAVVTLAGGLGSRWTSGAGVVKSLNPFCKLGGAHRSFLELHLAKSRRTMKEYGAALQHAVTTSYLTHEPIREALGATSHYGYTGPLWLSQGKSIGLRMIPMTRDLKFAWEEVSQQLLDEQAQKVRQSSRAALMNWALAAGEGSNYTDNVPMQCLHPVGHWYEVPNMLRNGTLSAMLDKSPRLKHLMVHNVDTVGANLDPGILAAHIGSKAGMTVEVIPRHLEDRGGGLARVDGRLRIVEGLALPSEEIESELSYYNSNTIWIDIDQLLAVFGLSRGELSDTGKVARAIRHVATRVPAYITLKDVKKRWGKGQEDIFPVCQFEQSWGDMTALPDLACTYVEVSRYRGQQMKEAAQLDSWLRDGSAQFVESICDFGQR